jgi:hypothetical protein
MRKESGWGRVTKPKARKALAVEGKKASLLPLQNPEASALI